MKKGIYLLYGFSVLAILLSFQSINVKAVGIADYQFPDYISVDKRIYKAKWRKKSGDTYQNLKGAENVIEENLTQLSYDNIALSCVKFKEGVQTKRLDDSVIAEDVNGNRISDYCESGYSVSFDEALESGALVQEDGVWKLKVCDYYARGLESKIGDITQPENIVMTEIGGGRYRITFKVLEENPGVFMFRKLKYSTYEANGMTQYRFDDSGNPGTYTEHFGSSLDLAFGESFAFQFYVNGNSEFCSSEFVAEYRAAAPMYISNPVIKYTYDDGRNMCDVLKNEFSTDPIAKGMIPTCYKNVINYGEEIPSRESIMLTIAQVQDMIRGKSSVPKDTSSGSNIRKCEFVSGGDGIKTTTGGNTVNTYKASITNKYLESSLKYKYWRVECSEEMTVSYDDPKAVNAGGGFSYTTIITLTRTCHPVQIKVPEKKSLCVYYAVCNGRGHDHSINCAGPNEDFDQCIQTCDGGKYSQDCIDSCYQEVYGNTDVKTVSYTDTNHLGLLSISNKQKGVVPITTYFGENASSCPQECPEKGKFMSGSSGISGGIISSCCTIDNNSGCKRVSKKAAECYTEHGRAVYFDDGCNPKKGKGSVKCTEILVTTDDCAANAEKLYYEEVKQAKDEYSRVVASIQGYTEGDYKDEEIQTGVYDNYLNKQVNFGKNQQPITNVAVTNSTSGDQTRAISSVTQDAGQYTVTQDMLNYTWRQYTTTRTQIVHLTQSYVSNTSNQKLGVGTIYQKKTMNCERDDKNHDLCTKYYNGGYKFYTNLLAPTINDYREWPYYNPANTDKTIQKFTAKGDKYENIDVDLKNFGSWNQWTVNIDCIYGLYQNYVKDSDDCDPSKDICSGGIQYIYREIELEDNFPNERDPRWNWTGTIDTTSVDGRRLVTGAARYNTASYRGYNIDPLALVKHIEGNGNTIYNVKKDGSEVDYEFVLTRQNLRNIRSYNANVQDYNKDGNNNYLDYDMSCYTKRVGGQDIQVCTNNFLDDDRYVTYSSPGFTVASRKKIAECNNAKNQECYDVSSKN